MCWGKFHGFCATEKMLGFLAAPKTQATPIFHEKNGCCKSETWDWRSRSLGRIGKADSSLRPNCGLGKSGAGKLKPRKPKSGNRDFGKLYFGKTWLAKPRARNLKLEKPDWENLDRGNAELRKHKMPIKRERENLERENAKPRNAKSWKYQTEGNPERKNAKPRERDLEKI